MKQFYVLLTFLVTSFTFGQEQLLNGDFENWDNATSPTSFTHIEDASQESIEVHSGAYSVKHTGGTSDLGQLISGIVPGEEYTLTLWYKVESGDNTSARVWSYWKNGEDNISDNANELRGPNNSYFDNNSGQWTEYTVTLNAPANADGFYFEVRTYSGAIVYWDDFSFYKTETGSEPSLQVNTPNNEDTFPSGTTSVNVEFSTSNIDLNLAGNQVNITVNSILFEDVDSPYSITTIDGETYNVTVDLLEGGSVVDSESLSFSIDEPVAGCPAVGSIIITEIMQNPDAVSDANGEYFELYNTTDDPIDVQGWTISDAGSDSFVVNSSVVINPQSQVVFAINGDSNTNGNIPVVSYVYSGFSLANGDDEIILTCPGGNVIDQVFYDGGATFPDPTGISMELALSAYNSSDNDLGSNWGEAVSAFGDGDLGTPGEKSDFILSIGQQNTVNFKVYPNPTSTGFVNIVSAHSETISVNVYDMLGKQVINKTIANNRLNVSTLNAGVYIMKISQGNTATTQKIVIK